MLILFETPAGYALFKANEKKLQKVDNIFDEFFSTPEKAQDLCVGRRSLCVSVHGRIAA